MLNFLDDFFILYFFRFGVGLHRMTGRDIVTFVKTVLILLLGTIALLLWLSQNPIMSAILTIALIIGYGYERRNLNELRDNCRIAITKVSGNELTLKGKPVRKLVIFLVSIGFIVNSCSLVAGGGMERALWIFGEIVFFTYVYCLDALPLVCVFFKEYEEQLQKNKTA